MITMICGLPRAGKTALATAFALNEMRGDHARQRVLKAQKEIETYKKGGFRRFDLQSAQHLVFADYTITASKRRSIRSYEVDGYYIGLPNDQGHPVKLLPPCSFILLDEAQRYYNSRLSTYFPDFVSRFFELHGQVFYDLILICQRPGLIDKNIRELTKRVIYVTDLTFDRKDGLIVACNWTGFEYESAESAKAYIESGFSSNMKGKKFGYRYDHNVFRHYDSFGHAGAFFKGAQDRGFDMFPAKEFDHTVKGVDEYNATHTMSAPPTFFKPKK